MGKTKIEWVQDTDGIPGMTWNPIRGCSRKSPGCDNCFAMRQARRMDHRGGAYEGLTRTVTMATVDGLGVPGEGPSRVDWSGEVRLMGDKLREPIRWRRPRHVFVNSMSDLFHEKLSDDDIDCVFGVMWACRYLGPHAIPGHTFQVLTKRPQRMLDYLSQDRRKEWAYCAVNYGGGEDPDPLWDSIMFEKEPHPRIWLGVTAEDQPRADERVPLLLRCPAAVYFVSYEPGLGPVDLERTPTPESWREKMGTHAPRGSLCAFSGLDWVIVGCESGPRARPMPHDWARSLRDQCAEANTPFFCKQLGANEDGTGPLVKMPELDGRVWAEMPEGR